MPKILKRTDELLVLREAICCSCCVILKILLHVTNNTVKGHMWPVDFNLDYPGLNYKSDIVFCSDTDHQKSAIPSPCQ